MRLMMSRIEAVLFDLDGVLANTDASVTDLWRRAASLVGRSLTDGELRADVIGCAPEHTIERLFHAYPEADRRRVLEEVRAGEPGLAHQSLPGAQHLVRALASASVPLALVTGASADRAAAFTSGLGIADCFKVMVTWDVANRGKPDPQPYNIAADRLGVQPTRCVAFEDSVNGVRAAVAAGATCVAVSNGGAANHLRAAGAFHIVTSLTQVRLAWDAESARSRVEPVILADAHG